MVNRVLVADDDKAVRESLVRALTLEGYSVSSVNDGGKALEMLRVDEHDALVLDLMMPVIDGLTVCRVLRSEKNRIPILMLTARAETSDRVQGLDAGADDYLPKPFDPRELAARVRAILRRAPSPGAADAGGGSGTVVAAPNDTPLQYGPLLLDPRRRRAALRGTQLELTGAEWRVLLCLAQSVDAPVERGALTQQALGRKLALYDRAIDTHVSNLRRKISAAGGGVQIRAVRGSGYELIEDGSA